MYVHVYYMYMYTHVQLDCSLNDLKAVLASSRQMQMADLICYMKLRKKIGLRAFIFVSLSRVHVDRGDLRQAPFIYMIFFSSWPY